MIHHLKDRLADIEEYFLQQDDYQSKSLDAAVLVAFTQVFKPESMNTVLDSADSSEANQPRIVLTRRSKNMRSHAGEVAFPGGKIELIDKTYSETALRESEEEIGLKPDHVELIGQIDPMISRQGVKVQPIVGVLNADLDYIPTSEELDAVFKVPVAHFYDDSARVMHRFKMEDKAFEISAFQYQDFTIWGLTAAIIVKVLNQINDTQIADPTIKQIE